jgi:hypothetical protein
VLYTHKTESIRSYSSDQCHSFFFFSLSLDLQVNALIRHDMEALAAAGLMPLPTNQVDPENSNVSSTTRTESLYPIINDETTSSIGDVLSKLAVYPTLDELKSMIDQQGSDTEAIIEPPSIEPLKDFIVKRANTIECLKDLRARMAKHVLNCKISNTVGNSASIVGGILCFVFPLVGVPVLLAGTATSLGTYRQYLTYIIYKCNTYSMSRHSNHRNSH